MRIFTPCLFFQCVFTNFQCVITPLHALSVALENYYKLKRYKEHLNVDYYLHRPGFNPSSRATYTIFHPSTNNFFTTMSVGRALLSNPGCIFILKKQHCGLRVGPNNVPVIRTGANCSLVGLD